MSAELDRLWAAAGSSSTTHIAAACLRRNSPYLEGGVTSCGTGLQDRSGRQPTSSNTVALPCDAARAFFAVRCLDSWLPVNAQGCSPDRQTVREITPAPSRAPKMTRNWSLRSLAKYSCTINNLVIAGRCMRRDPIQNHARWWTHRPPVLLH